MHKSLQIFDKDIQPKEKTPSSVLESMTTAFYVKLSLVLVY